MDDNTSKLISIIKDFGNSDKEILSFMKIEIFEKYQLDGRLIDDNRNEFVVDEKNRKKILEVMRKANLAYSIYIDHPYNVIFTK
ncbi:MAG: hypothetical protein AB8G86_19690 [Saprospiraceae bacterium]